MYAKQPGAFLSKQDGEFYIILNLSIFSVNEVGARIFDLCDGQNTLNNISDKLLSIFDIKKDELNKDIEEYIGLLMDKGLIYENC